MEMCKRIESGEILLPEAIVQHIQSFMTGKEAAQTSLVSKYWYSAWSTRPNLDFNCSDFLDRGGLLCDHRFSDFAKKTIQRYEKLNLTIQSVNILVKYSRHSLANELIVKAMQMGATHLKLELTLELTGDPNTNTMFSLPQELLESETLVRLSVSGCKIDLGVNDGKVSWPRLKSLTLHIMYVEGDAIWDIISVCPLIEELVLSQCKYVSRQPDTLVLGPKPFELRKLRCLSLGYMKIDTSFFCDLSFKFPCLKDLTIHHCYDYNSIEISSPSLERISFEVKRKVLKANFEVPCIRKFTFSGLSLPSLSFGTSSSSMGKWESDISVWCLGNRKGYLPSSWFLELKKFLTDLSPSRISLTLGISFICGDSCGDIQGLAKPPIVDNLRVLVDEPSFVYSALLDYLFWSCRPKLISSTIERTADIHFLELLYERLHRAENCHLPNRNTMFGRLRDLKEVNVEFYDENLSQWRPALSMKALLGDYYPFKRTSRFKLRWG